MTAAPLTVMTYNLKHGGNAEHPWDERLPLLVDIVRRNDPDVLAVQEAYPDQMADLRTAFPEHGVLGQGREGGDAGEWSALLYRRDRLEVVGEDVFWLSDTPDVPGSNTWDARFPRMATVGRFRDRVSGTPITVLTTHTDHEDGPHGDATRVRSAELVVARLADEDGPVVVLGDFNEGAGQGGESVPFARAGFVDTWTTAGDPDDATNSFNGWEPPTSGSVRIDWVLVRGGIVAEHVHIDHDGEETWRASDHFPVVARLALP
jgi:endonuclease/exonuclease/phosphatase family metal-dependent hydrolase